jgi:hypothetical protein
VDHENVEVLKKQGGLDDRLAYHIASLFVRDPIPTYDYEHLDDGYNPKETNAHFENL